MSVIQYAVLATSLPVFHEMVMHKFQIQRSFFGGVGNKLTILKGEVNHVYNFAGTMEDLSNIPGEFNIVAIQPISVNNFISKVFKECARRKKIDTNSIYDPAKGHLEIWYHPDSEEGQRLKKLEVFKDIGT